MGQHNRGGRDHEVRAADVEVAQRVQRVFVVVGEQGRSPPGEAGVDPGQLLITRRGCEVGGVVLHRVGRGDGAYERERQQQRRRPEYRRQCGASLQCGDAGPCQQEDHRRGEHQGLAGGPGRPVGGQRKGHGDRQRDPAGQRVAPRVEQIEGAEHGCEERDGGEYVGELEQAACGDVLVATHQPRPEDLHGSERFLQVARVGGRCDALRHLQ